MNPPTAIIFSIPNLDRGFPLILGSEPQPSAGIIGRLMAKEPEVLADLALRLRNAGYVHLEPQMTRWTTTHIDDLPREDADHWFLDVHLTRDVPAVLDRA